MNKSTKLAIAALALAIVGFAALKLFSDDKKSESEETTTAKTVESVPAPKRAKSSEQPSSQVASMPTQVDDDPIGDLVLEGQVVDEDGHPVGGALVMLGSAPPKSTTSEEDGSFSFDKLVQRRYPVSARSDDRIGGPVVVTLSKDSDPVLVRMQAGGGIRVEVVDVADLPIASATVVIPSMDSLTATTDAKGIAEIHNVPPGMTMISVHASGYAKGHSLATVPRGKDTMGHQRLTLVRGVSVSGRVVDHEGNPVEDAKIIAQQSGAMMQVENPRHDGVSSGKDGRFELPAVPSGNVQLVAVHDDHAPSTSERFDVGDSAVKEIKLKMKEGASVSGRVVNASGEAVAWATVRVRSPQEAASQGMGTNRKMISDEDGGFIIKGLPREELALYGASESASSQSVEVDLRSKPEASKIQLVLDVEGMIKGRVVDENGDAVAEAQVQAVPDFWEGASLEQLFVRGPAFATTGGDGGFTIRGLPESKFKITASRGVPSDGRGLQRGVSAKTGDEAVRVVLATPASIVGKIQASDGSTPPVATVSIGWGTSVPVAGGRFRLSEVPPGSYELSVRGPDFASSFKSKVEVKAGEEHDVGTIEVKKGRSVAGRVLDASGKAIAGAEVVMARQLISDGSNLTPKGMGAAIDEQMGVRRTTSDERGNYRLRGIGENEWTIVADHPEIGRAIGQLVAKGTENAELDLALQPVGGVRGLVSVNGEPSAGVNVLITSEEGSAHIVIVKSDERGAYYAERVAAGNFKISAMKGSGGSSSMAATTATVKAGEVVEADLTIEEGDISLEVTISGVEGATIDAAQVFLFRGAADVKTGGELNKLFLSEASNAKMGFAFGKASAKFTKVTPANYSVCIIPINGDMNDPSFAQKLQRHVSEIAVYCQQLNITETPDAQTYNAVVPPMTPLPEE
jgi:protocatechuate 3,4-dioxygenase beta subunit